MADAANTAAASGSISCRCSGASRLTRPTASSQSRTTMMAPCACQLAPAMAARGRVGSSCCDRCRDRVGECGIVGDQDGLRRLVVLGLRQQIDGDAARIVGGVGQHDDLGRAGDRVDADAAEHLPLGLGDIGVARPDDAIDRRDAGGAIGQRRNRLRAADPIDLRHAGAPRRGQHQRVQHAIRARHAHGDARHAGDARRDRVHQHRGRIGRLAARHIQADRIQRRPAHAQGQAGCIRRLQVGGQLRAVERLDPRRGEIQRCHQIGADARRPRHRSRAARCAAGRPSGSADRSARCSAAAPRRPRRARRR